MAKLFNGFESGKIYEDLYTQGGTQQIVVEDDFITITIHFPELRQDGSWRSEWCTKTIIKGSFIFKGNTFDYLNSTVSELSLMGFQILQDGSITEYGYGYKFNDPVGLPLPGELTDETAEYVTFSYGSDESIDWTKGGPDTDAPKLAAFPVSNNRAVVERSGFGDFVPKGWIDSPFTTSLNDIVQGTSSKDTLKGGLGADTLFGNEGNDFLSGGTHKDKIYGGRGNDILDGGLGNDLLVGGNGKDTAVFSSKNNRINLSSSRRQNTRDGRDILRSIENVDGGGGNDFITGNKSANTINGEDGNDRLFGEAGNDRLIGGAGNDRLNGGNNNDRLFGDAGKDLLIGGAGNDRLNGGNNNDRLFGNAGKDLLIGGAGNDRINGGNNNDRLFGEAGDDVLLGGKGADTFNGGEGSDKYIGGNGADRFCINKGVGRDVITDYTSGEDKIKLLGRLKERNLTINQAGSDVRIKYEDDLLAIVRDTIVADINFI